MLCICIKTKWMKKTAEVKKSKQRYPQLRF